MTDLQVDRRSNDNQEDDGQRENQDQRHAIARDLNEFDARLSEDSVHGDHLVVDRDFSLLSGLLHHADEDVLERKGHLSGREHTNAMTGEPRRRSLDPANRRIVRDDVQSIAKESEEHTSELQSHSDLHSSPPRPSSDLPLAESTRMP